MAVRSRRLWGVTNTAAGTQTVVYTVPAGRTAIIHSIFLATSENAIGGVALRVNGSGVNQTIYEGTIPAQGALIVGDELTLNPGDTLRVNAPDTQVNSLGCGSLLLGAPE